MLNRFLCLNAISEVNRALCMVLEENKFFCDNQFLVPVPNTLLLSQAEFT